MPLFISVCQIIGKRGTLNTYLYMSVFVIASNARNGKNKSTE